MAEQFSRRNGIPHVGLRFSNIMEPHDYERFSGWQDDPHERKWNLWGYVDARDVAQSCRLGAHGETTGAEFFGITAADTVMERPSRELMGEIYPDVPLRDVEGRQTLHSIAKAQKLLGFEPRHSWRDS